MLRSREIGSACGGVSEALNGWDLEGNDLGGGFGSE